MIERNKGYLDNYCIIACNLISMLSLLSPSSLLLPSTTAFYRNFVTHADNIRLFDDWMTGPSELKVGKCKAPATVQ